MRDLNFELKQLCQRSRDSSYATLRGRARALDVVAGQLQELGYRHMAAVSLKPKHVEALVERWHAEGLWLSDHEEPDGRTALVSGENRQSEIVIARDNDHSGIGKRQYVTNVSKARDCPAANSAESPTRTPQCRNDCRLHSVCGAENRSRFGRNGPTGATSSC